MDVEKEIRKVLWGKSIVNAKNKADIEQTYILRSLTIAEQNLLDFIHQQSLDEALSSNVLTHEELEYFYLNNEIWTQDDEDEILRIKKDIKKLKGQRSKIRTNKFKIKILTKKIDNLEFDLNKLTGYKRDLFSVSAERYAEEIMNRHMIYLSATDENDKPIWESKEDFLNSTDEILLFNLTIKYLNENISSESKLREVARSGVWRYRWTASKNGESLFGKPISEWSYVQNSLVYWSQYYDYVFEHPDRPDNRTIEDDVALDKWVEDQNKESRKSKLGSSNKKNFGAKKGEFIEEFVIVEDADPDVIKEIYDENTSTSKMIVNKTKQQIKEKGSVKDWEVKKDFRKGK